jgi:hypothetical protein
MANFIFTKELKIPNLNILWEIKRMEGWPGRTPVSLDGCRILERACLTRFKEDL